MDIQLDFSKQISDWAPEHIYKRFYEWFESHYSEHNVMWLNNSTPGVSKNPGGPGSPHIITIKNLYNGKYIAVSYHDRAFDLYDSSWDGYGELVQVITSCGLHHQDDDRFYTLYNSKKLTPFTYHCFDLSFEALAEKVRLPFKEKKDNGLHFRGRLYAQRLKLSHIAPDIIMEDLINPLSYFLELNNSKICLSLDGNGIICNRDIEILSSGSVLLRPLLTQKTHNELIPNIHYIAFDKVNDDELQLEIIKQKYEEIRYNDELLETVAENGYKWYCENGTVDKNVDLLKELVDLTILI